MVIFFEGGLLRYTGPQATIMLTYVLVAICGLSSCSLSALGSTYNAFPPHAPEHQEVTIWNNKNPLRKQSRTHRKIMSQSRSVRSIMESTFPLYAVQALESSDLDPKTSSAEMDIRTQERILSEQTRSHTHPSRVPDFPLSVQRGCGGVSSHI